MKTTVIIGAIGQVQIEKHQDEFVVLVDGWEWSRCDTEAEAIESAYAWGAGQCACIIGAFTPGFMGSAQSTWLAAVREAVQHGVPQGIAEAVLGPRSRVGSG